MRSPVPALLLATAIVTTTADAAEWHEVGDLRWRSLTPTASPDRTVGFTRLQPDATGITFINELSEEALPTRDI